VATAPLPAAAPLAPIAPAPERLPPGTLAAYSLPSLGVGALMGLLLQLSGFEPGAEQTPGALLGLRLAIAGVPCLGMAVVLALLRGLPERE